jgi:hypothetical protein
MMEAILLNMCEKCDTPLVSTQDKPSFCNNTECEYYDLTIVNTPFCFANKGDSEENMKADLAEEKALKDLLYVVDGMCDCYRKRNYGEAQEWARHVNDAYTNYQESTENDSA